MKKDKTLNEVSRKLLGRYIDRITAQPGMEKGDPRQRSYSKRQKNAAGLERAFNKSSPYGKSGSNPVKVSATEEVELTEMQGDDYNQAGWNHDPYDYNKGKWTQVKKILTNKEAAKSASKIANRIAKQIAQKKVKEEVELDENRDAEYMKMHGMTHSEFHKLPQAERIKRALSAVNKSFSTPPEGHKDAKTAPVKKPEPKQGAGMPFYPENSGRRNMGDSVEMNGETISELSKKTLGSYIKKASDKATQHASVKAQSVADIHYDSKGNPVAKFHGDMKNKRLQGIVKATDKLTKEEVERVDELSKATVDSYSDKARMDRNDVLGIALRKYSSPEEKAKYKAIADKRGRGQMIAQAKLSPDGIYRYSDRTIAKQAKVVATEEVEQIDELSKDTLASYNRKAWDDRQAIGRKLPDLAKKSTLYRGKTYTKDERDTAEKAHNQAQKLSHKYGQRTKGIETSEKKWMAKEEVEVMNEEVSTKPDGRFPGRHHVFWKGNKLNVRIQNADAGTGSGGRSNNRYRNHFLEYVAPDGINTTKRIRVGTLGDAKRLVTNLMKKRDALRAGETVKESAYGMEKAVEAGRKERIQRRIRDRQVIHHQNTAVHKAAEKFTKKTD